MLGAGTFGVLEFASSLLAYLLLIGDAGLEIWGTREAAQATDLRALAARVLPLRFLGAIAAVLVLLAALPALPDYPALRTLMLLFGLSLFAQAASLKWVFMGRQQMSRVAAGLVISQIVFALAVFAFVRTAEGVLWVPLLRFASDAALALWFARQFAVQFGGLGFSVRWSGAGEVLKPALTIGASNAMGLLNYNFDTVLLGFLKGATVVGWYNAAYKPVTIALALPLTYFAGLFPALSKSYAENREQFARLVERSFRLCAVFAIPLGVGGTLLAEPIIALLFGPEYANSALPFRILVWSAVFVILRGSYRHSLNAAGHQKLDLRCAVTSALLNVGLNILLIPPFGMTGSASATVIADVAWFVMACFFFQRAVLRLNPLPTLARPVLAGGIMAALLQFVQQPHWMGRGAMATAAYFVALLALGEPEVRQWLRRKARAE